MATIDDLMRLEAGFWHATRNPGYYSQHMRDDGLAVFSAGVMDKEAARRSTEGDTTTEWADVRIEEAQLLDVADGVSVLVYVGRAHRAGVPYAATCSSVYACAGRSWQLVLHQQSQRDEGASS